MTASQATHLIEQFAAQCPLAIWILDSRGVSIFANAKLHEVLEIESSPSEAVGIRVLDLECIKKLNLEKYKKRLMNGESVSTTVRIENLSEMAGDIQSTRTKPLVLRIIAYTLKSSTQAIEHFVIFLEDGTETHLHHENLREQTRDIKTFMRAKKTRKERLGSLKEQVKDIRKRIEKLGQEPVA